MKRTYVMVVVLGLLLAACGDDAGDTSTTAGDGTSDTTAAAGGMEDLIAAAQEEGTLTTIALPDDWCNYRAVIDGFKAKYDMEVNELDPGAGSRRGVGGHRRQQGQPGTTGAGRDRRRSRLRAPGQGRRTDPGVQGVQPGTTSRRAPRMLTATGTATTTACSPSRSTPPKWPTCLPEYADLLDPAYNGQVALSGDPLTSNAAILTVWAAGLATGATGTEAAEAGLHFFADLNAAGNFVPIDGDSRTVGIGETPILIDWSYNSIANDVALAGNPDLETVVPSDGRLAGVYVQAISAYAPHPNAAKLWMEYLYSDEGQLGWAAGLLSPDPVSTR